MRKDCVTDREHGDQEVTTKLNEVLATESSGIDQALRKAQARSVGSSSLPRARDYGSRWTSASAIPRSPATAYRK